MPPLIAAAPIAGAATAGIGATIASVAVPALIGAVGGLGSALIAKKQGERQAGAQIEAAKPARLKAALTPEQQAIAGRLGTGLGGVGVEQLAQGTGLGFNTQDPRNQSMAQNLDQRISRLRAQLNQPTGPAPAGGQNVLPGGTPAKANPFA